MSRIGTSQTLLFDADDTLWENNVYFEQAIANFISFLDHHAHNPHEVREHLNRAERATIAAYGYGVKSFRRSLVACFEELTCGQVTGEVHARIVNFADAIADREVELLSGVAATLARLVERHRLVLVTKGDEVEQRDKLRRSGLEAHFAAVEVLPEKHEAAYRELAKHHRCELKRTWMIGNSPRSDINPALAAGLNAVFVAHESTWVLEQEALVEAPAGQRLIKAQSFGDLLHYF